MLNHEIIANGKCSVCGKPLTGKRIFVCEKCQRTSDQETLKKVMYGLEHCTMKHNEIISPCVGCPYNEECKDILPLLKDAYVLLQQYKKLIAIDKKEQL